LKFFDGISTPTRPSLRDGHPPHAFRGGGIRRCDAGKRDADQSNKLGV
jgi:hypothetical protein